MLLDYLVVELLTGVEVVRSGLPVTDFWKCANEVIKSV